MDFLLYGIINSEIPRDLYGQTLWIVNGWTGASGGAAPPPQASWKPIMFIY